MSARLDLWLSRSRLWLPALVFVALNLTLLFTYRLTVSVRLGAQEQAVTQSATQLGELRREREELEAAVARGRTVAEQVAYLEDERFATQAERLTATMAIVRSLARDAGLRGLDTISYPEERVEGFGLVQKSFVFSAQGSYAQLRELINLLEVTESFLILEEIRVGGREGGGQLQIQLRLTTLFVDDAPPRGRA